jgi:hypothetical protein
VVDFPGTICNLCVVHHVCRVLRYGCTCMLVMLALMCVKVIVISSASDSDIVIFEIDSGIWINLFFGSL